MGGHLGCAQLLDPDQDPESMSVSKFDIFYTFLTADPILTKLVKYVVHVYMNMCVTPFLDPDQI